MASLWDSGLPFPFVTQVFTDCLLAPVVDGLQRWTSEHGKSNVTSLVLLDSKRLVSAL